MPPTKNKRQTIADIFGGVDDLLRSAVTQEEMQQILTEIASSFRQLTALVNEKMAENKAGMEGETKRLSEEGSNLEKRLLKLIETKNTGTKQEFDKKLTQLSNELSAEIGYVESLIEKYDDSELREHMIAMNEMLAKMPEEFDPTGIAEDIEKLEKEVDELKKRPTGTGGGVRRVFQPYLDRFQGDGSTKIFYLKREPLRTDNIEVWGTDFPIVLDPDNDFTVVGKTLTLTNAVDAPTNGAIIVIKYYA